MILKLMGMQKKLDSTIKPLAKRGEDHIVLSAIAECVEFNEELYVAFRHKTWKENKLGYSEDRRNEEMIDILFFLVQWGLYKGYQNNDIMIRKIDNMIDVVFFNKSNNGVTDKNFNPNLLLLDIIRDFASFKYTGAFYKYLCLAKSLGFTKTKLFSGYIKKWEKNLGRTGTGEWNGK